MSQIIEEEEVVIVKTIKRRASGKIHEGPPKREPLHFLDIWIFIFFGFLTRLYKLSQPNSVVFDEVHFGGFTNNYYKQTYYFDIHPPLGKLLLYLGSLFLGYADNEGTLCNYTGIGVDLRDCCATCLRVFPALFGATLPPLAYLFTHFAGGSRLASILSGGMVLFDIAYVTQNRHVWMEPFLFCFVLCVGCWSFYLRNRVMEGRLTKAAANQIRRAASSELPPLEAHLEYLRAVKEHFHAIGDSDGYKQFLTLLDECGSASMSAEMLATRLHDTFFRDPTSHQPHMPSDLVTLVRGFAVFLPSDAAISVEDQSGHIAILPKQQEPITSATTTPASAEQKGEAALSPEMSYALTMTGLGLSLCCVLGVKWMPGAASFLAVFAQHCLTPLIKLDRWKARWRFIEQNFAYYLIFLLVIPFIVYFSFYHFHFAWTPLTGPGDGFHTPEFKAALVGSADNKAGVLRPMGLAGRFWELNTLHLKMNMQNDSHSYASRWYGWVFNRAAMSYWSGKEIPGETVKGAVGHIYLMGNTVVWYTATLCLIATVCILIHRFLVRRAPFANPQREQLLSVQLELVYTFLLHWTPYTFIGRTTFLYHYMPALLISIQNAALLYDFVTADLTHSRRRAILASFLAVVIAYFFMLNPLSYGMPGLNPSDPRWSLFLQYGS